MIIHKRMVSADGILRNRVDLRAYPHRHLAVVAYFSVGGIGVTEVLAAVEVLEQHGWRLVNVSEFKSNQVMGFLRRD